MNMRVLVAMSGGVDSSIAAAILKRKGYGVIGATFKFWSEEPGPEDAPRGCYSLRDMEDARLTCARLGIPHYVFDCRAEFEKQVIDYFCNEYLNGRTPNPCIVCNEKIKFDFLLGKADELGCEYIATGHYARSELDPRSGRWALKEAKDAQKDQSYVLFALSQRKLARAIFPLGDFTKDEVRALALKLGLEVHDKADSQEICFIRSGDCASFLKSRLKGRIRPGEIVDTLGRVVGAHAGICFYTIGQRKAIGAHGTPKYVVKIAAAENRVIIGDYDDISQRSFYVKRTNWLLHEEPRVPLEAKVKVRYLHPKTPAVVYPVRNAISNGLYPEKERMRVELLTPQPAITPGQAAVFYDGETVLGGGWITEH